MRQLKHCEPSCAQANSNLNLIQSDLVQPIHLFTIHQCMASKFYLTAGFDTWDSYKQFEPSCVQANSNFNFIHNDLVEPIHLSLGEADTNSGMIVAVLGLSLKVPKKVIHFQKVRKARKAISMLFLTYIYSRAPINLRKINIESCRKILIPKMSSWNNSQKLS